MQVENLSGRIIRGYELHRLLGVGGFGAVYAATQPLVGRDVAIKVILPDYANHPEFVRRFESEARMVARLEHPFIIPLYDYWREPSSAYLVMRFLAGGSLDDFMKEHGPLEVELVVQIISQVASALSVAHRAGIVHRDLKPANILLDPDHNAYLADFGIALEVTNQSTADDEDTTVGSPAYLSPEQITANPITPQSDIYSLGIVLFQMLTGHHPYPVKNIMQMLRMQLDEPLPSVQKYRDDLPTEIDNVLAWATAKDPRQRYSDVMSLANDVVRVLGSSAEGQRLAQRTTTPEAHFSTMEVPAGTLILSQGDSLIQNPYMGLRPFEEADAPNFFGREQLVNQLIARMSEKGYGYRFLAVVGPSGSGKSSVVQAGLIPALRRGALRNSAQWYITEFTPGQNALSALTSALLSVATVQVPDLTERITARVEGLHEVVNDILPAEGELLLYIDQFEELFTQLDDEALRLHLLRAITHAVLHPDSRLRVIVTIRADFYDRPLLYSGFGELMQQRTEVVLPMTAAELEAAITEPARRVGLRLDKRLVSAVIADVNEQPGALPLLQFALAELFERRSDRTLSFETYKGTGGVSGALARRAEDLYQQLDEQGQNAARQLFLQLVTLGEGVEDTRRRINWQTVRALQERNPATQSVLDLYGKYRLLTFDIDKTDRSPTVEVAHEALIQRWERLREWIDESREELRIQRRAIAAAREWINQGRDDSFLATGNRLVQFEEWLDHTDLAVTPEVYEYIFLSAAKRETELEAERRRKEREQKLEARLQKVLLGIVGVLLLGLVGSGVATFLALQQRADAQEARRIAEENAREAESAQRIAEANADASQLNANIARINLQRANRNAEEAKSLSLAAAALVALSNHNTDLAILLALEANKIDDPPPLAQRALLEAGYAPGTRFRMDAHTDWVRSVAFSPSAEYAASGAQDGHAIIWDMNSGEMVHDLVGHNGSVFAVEFSRDGVWLATGGSDSHVIIWDVETGQQVMDLAAEHGNVWGLDFSPNNGVLAASYEDGTVILWSLRSMEPLKTFMAHDGRVWDVAYAPDNRRIVTVGEDQVARVWDTVSDEILVEFTGHQGRIHSVDISSRGGLVVTAGAGDNAIYLWRLSDGEQLARFAGHADQVYGAVFSPNNREIISVSQDGSLRIWNITTGLEILHLQGHTAAVRAVAVSPYGDRAITGSYDTTVRVWDLKDGSQVAQLFGHRDDVYDVAVSPDGTRALSGGFDSEILYWDLTRQVVLRRFSEHTDWVRDIEFSPDGRYAISGSYDRTAIIWDLETYEPLHRLEGHANRIWSVAYSPTGEVVATGDQNGEIRLWSPLTGEYLGSLIGHNGWVRGISFSPDGTKLVSASGGDLSIRVWDVATQTQLAELYGHDDWLWSASWSPDGRYFVTSASDTRILLWDAETYEIIRRYEGHTSPVNKVAFGPNSQIFASASSDGTLRVWDVETGAELRRFSLSNAGAWGVAFDPSGEYIISANTDATLTIWRIGDASELVEWIFNNRYVRELTCYEREQNDIEPLCE
ncbi:MAG: hypothetical protein CUN55_02220 [Phototrophicales bacterium]|nr:MAG: hypothetical protein CUN55_02220 [Phototrophicales bacterium]